jgi:hypothetical protein
MRNVFLMLTLGTILVTQCHHTTPGTIRSAITNKQGEPRAAEPAKLWADVRQTVNNAAYRLMQCCSGNGGINFESGIYRDSYQTDKDTGEWSVIMTAEWKGSITGMRYWLKGRLTVTYLATPGGAAKEWKRWTKIDDAGPFVPGCARNCDLN